MKKKLRLSIPTVNVLIRFLQEPEREFYGLELIRQTDIPSGTLYPILARLEKLKWLESDWETSVFVKEGRRPRRYYKLTASGADEARVAIQRAMPASKPLLSVS